MPASGEHSIKTWQFLYRIAFGFFAAYFFLMGLFLLLFPGLLLQGLGVLSSQTLIGIIRGTGGATVPYAFLYLLIAVKPMERQWAVWVILFANCLAVLADLSSILLSE